MAAFSNFTHSSTTTTTTTTVSDTCIDDLQGRIRSANFVYLITPSHGNGKTPTTEDYCDFVHIDGGGLAAASSSPSSWKPCFEDLAARALRAARTSLSANINIVISCNSTHQMQASHQDFLVKRLIAGGASEEKITVVRLAAGGAFACDPIQQPHSHGSYRTQYCTWRPKKKVQTAVVVAQTAVVTTSAVASR
eukprot:jgi/Psemu1/14835/gm1.14835_g